jgi:hypothetical protein
MSAARNCHARDSDAVRPMRCNAQKLAILLPSNPAAIGDGISGESALHNGGMYRYSRGHPNGPADDWEHAD